MSFGPIQMLDVIVDPTVDALLTDDGFDGQGDPVGPTDGVEDPRNPGTYVPHGGSGVSRRRHPLSPPPSPPSGPIALVQSSINGFGFDTAERNPVLAADVGTNHFLVAVIATVSADTNAGLTVQGSGVGMVYTEVPGAEQYQDPLFGNYLRISIWYHISSSSADGSQEKVLRVTPTGSALQMDVCMLEYRNVVLASPLDSVNGNAVAGSFPTDWTAHSVAVNGPDELIIAGFASANTDETGNFSATNGYTLIKQLPNGSISPYFSDISLFVQHKLLLQVADEPTAHDIGGNQYVSIGASFRKA